MAPRNHKKKLQPATPSGKKLKILSSDIPLLQTTLLTSKPSAAVWSFMGSLYRAVLASQTP